MTLISTKIFRVYVRIFGLDNIDYVFPPIQYIFYITFRITEFSNHKIKYHSNQSIHIY